MVLPKAPRKTPTSKASKGNFTCKGCGKEFPKEELYKYKAKNFCLECGTKARREDRTKKKEEALLKSTTKSNTKITKSVGKNLSKTKKNTSKTKREK